MTFESKTLEVGRRAANIVELDLDRCSLSYGRAACTASSALRNYLLQSETFENATWLQGGSIVGVANQANNPVDGALTADKVQSNTLTASQKDFYQTIALPGFVTHNYTLSFFFNPQEVQFVALAYAEAGAETAQVNFDLVNGIVVDELGTHSPTGKIRAVPDFFEPGWMHAIMDFTPANPLPGTQAIGFRIYPDSTFTQSNVMPVGDGVFVYGGQIYFEDQVIRPNPRPGKYVPTTTVAVDGMGTSDELCFNTFETCQDTANYNNVPQTYSFIERLNLPTAAIESYPAVKGISYGSTKLDPGGGLAVRGKVTANLQDFTNNDNNIDDYVRERSYDPETRGTFFGKLLARNKFWLGRPMRVREGYIDDPFTLSNFRTREYIIENITGPDKTGRVSIIGKDPLTLAANNKAKCPVPSTGTLAIALTATGGAGVAVTVSGGDGADYDVDAHIRIDDEILLITSRLVDVLTCTRAQGGTALAAHEIGATMQSCKTYDDEPVIDIVQDLLENFSGVSSSFIPFTDWEAEETASLSGYDLTTIISEPTGVQKLLKEIVEVTLLDIWYSDTDQEIKLKLQTPFTDVTQVLTDEFNVLEKSLSVKTLNAKRLTRVLIYYGVRNFARDLTETENYSLANFEIEADKEGQNKFDDIKTKIVFSRWMDASNTTQIALTSQRLLQRFGNMPVEVTFELDAKDVPNLQTGDVYDLETRIIQGTDGLPAKTRMQIVETKPVKPSSKYKYTSLAFFEDPTTDTTVVSANETDYNLFVELGGPPGPVDVTVTINSLVVIRGSQGNPAFTTEGMHPDSTVSIVNNGQIYGHGGPGGDGGDANSTADGIKPGVCLYFGTAQNGFSGIDGGDAIECTVAALTIDNTSGEIFAGAGGGGGGDGIYQTTSNESDSGAGGGGGLGADTADGGDGGVATAGGSGVCGPDLPQQGGNGTDGSEIAEGTGGTTPGIGVIGGDGGDDWGEDGSASPQGGSGGAGGFAVRLNGATITWLGGNDAASVKGDVA